jgi:hypothetical protein
MENMIGDEFRLEWMEVVAVETRISRDAIKAKNSLGVPLNGLILSPIFFYPSSFP